MIKVVEVVPQTNLKLKVGSVYFTELFCVGKKFIKCYITFFTIKNIWACGWKGSGAGGGGLGGAETWICGCEGCQV